MTRASPIPNGMHTVQWHRPAPWLVLLAACLALLTRCTGQPAEPTNNEPPLVTPVPTFTATPPIAPTATAVPTMDQEPAQLESEPPVPKATPPPAAAETLPTKPIGTGQVINATVLNVRDSPDINGSRLGQLPNHAVVQVLDGTADKQWWHVCCLPDGVTSGWVYGQYLDVSLQPSAGDGTAHGILPTATIAPRPSPPTAPPTATPISSPRTPEEEAHAALSQLLPWYDHPPYPLAVVPILEVWLRDPEFGRELAQAPWITDGLNRLEDDAIYGLGHMYDHDPALARRLLAYTMDEPVLSRDTMFLGSLNEMILGGHKAKLELLLAQPWFTDGLDAEERAFIVAVQKITGMDVLYESTVVSPRITQSKTIHLPLAGEVTLWVFHNPSSRLTEDILAGIERGARGAERLMGMPFPLTDLVVLSLDLESCDNFCGGVNFVDSLVLVGSGGQFVGDMVLYHEIAHFYLTAELGPFWVYEGGATFVSVYVAQTARGDPLGLEEEALSQCQEHGVPNLHELNNPNHPDPVWQQTCGYTLGLYLLTNLFTTMGEAAFSSAMRELYGMYLDYQYYATDEQVYRIFLKHTPVDREATFRDLYRRLHGGPFLDGN